jgi:integrase
MRCQKVQTIHKRLQSARSFFLAMRRRKLIDENPFDGVKAAATGIKDRQRFVSREEIARVLDACPDHHWRAIVALSRFGGLRCPSEVLSLRWQDIDWDDGRIVVTSPKTEHHADKASRTIPLFPELRPILAEAYAWPRTARCLWSMRSFARRQWVRAAG